MLDRQKKQFIDQLVDLGQSMVRITIKNAPDKLLGEEDPKVRKVVVAALGKFDSKNTFSALVKALEDPDDQVRIRAVKSLRNSAGDKAAPHLIKAALEDREHLHKVENAPTAELRASRAMPHMIRTMWTGGFVALYDFFKNAPLTVAKHVKVDAYYNKHGRFRNQPLTPDEVKARMENPPEVEAEEKEEETKQQAAE